MREAPGPPGPCRVARAGPAAALVTAAAVLLQTASNQTNRSGSGPPLGGRRVLSSYRPVLSVCPSSRALGKPSSLQDESAGVRWNLRERSAPGEKSFC